MPRNYSAVLRGLAEQLVVPEAYGSAQKLRRGHDKRWAPQDVVKCGLDSPGAQRVKQNRVRVLRFVRVVLVEESMARVRFRSQTSQLRPQKIHLCVIEQTNASQVAQLMIGSDLFIAEAVLFPFLPALRPLEETAEWLMNCRQIVVHRCYPERTQNTPRRCAGGPAPAPNGRFLRLALRRWSPDTAHNECGGSATQARTRCNRPGLPS